MGMEKDQLERREGSYFVGIDSGSTTTKCGRAEREGTLVDSAIVRTGAKAQRGAEKAFEMLKIPKEEIALIVATGYGRNNISFADEAVYGNHLSREGRFLSGRRCSHDYRYWRTGQQSHCP